MKRFIIDGQPINRTERANTQYNEFGLFRLMVAIAERARRDVEVDCEIYSGNQIEEITADMKHEAQEWLEDTGLAILDAYAPGYSPAGWQTRVKPPRKSPPGRGDTVITPGEILAAVECLGGAGIGRISAHLGRNRNAVRGHVAALVATGELHKCRNNYYRRYRLFEGVQS